MKISKDVMIALDEEYNAEIEQNSKDVQFIRKLKKTIDKKLFRFFAGMLYYSENWADIKIVDKPTGQYQQENKQFGLWINQHCILEDSYSGKCYIELPDKTFISWEYWC